MRQQREPRQGCRPLTWYVQKAIHFSIDLATNKTSLAGALFAQTSNVKQIA
jgi:hypothetical protein